MRLFGHVYLQLMSLFNIQAGASHGAIQVMHIWQEEAWTIVELLKILIIQFCN